MMSPEKSTTDSGRQSRSGPMNLARSAGLIFSLLILCYLAGCSRGDNTLTGTWRNQTMQEIVEFKSDNTGVFLVKGSPSLPFKWSLLNGNSVRIEIPYQGQVRLLSGTVEKGMFTLNGREEQAVYVKTE